VDPAAAVAVDALAEGVVRVDGDDVVVFALGPGQVARHDDHVVSLLHLLDQCGQQFGD